MKNRYVKKVLRVMLLGVVFIGSLVVLGCQSGQRISDSEASEVMKEKLYEKYGEEFEVSESWRLTDTGVGMPTLGMGWTYCANVYTKDGQTFQVAIDNDGSNFEDDYGKIILEEPLREYVYGLVAEVGDAEIKRYNPVYYRDSYHWSEDDVETYLKRTRTYICLDIEISAESIDDAAQKCYGIAKVLEEHSVHALTTFWYDGADINVVTPFTRKTEEEIVKNITQKLENAIRNKEQGVGNVDKLSPVEGQDETESK